jgi:hypothetical protein
LVNRWFEQVPKERVWWDSASCGRNLGKLTGRFIVSSCDVNKLEAMELVLKLAYFLAISLHFWVMAARDFHDLIDDQLRVTSNVEASDS